MIAVFNATPKLVDKQNFIRTIFFLYKVLFGQIYYNTITYPYIPHIHKSSTTISLKFGNQPHNILKIIPILPMT